MINWFNFALKKIRFRWKTTDWRFWSVISATLVSIFITVIVPLAYPATLDASKFSGAFFASWASGVCLFALVGLIVAVASLSRPDKESFDTRARNFLRRQTGEHIEYIIKKMDQTLEPYVDYTEKKLMVTAWNQEEKKFQVSHETKSKLKSYLPDIETKFPGSLSYLSETKAPNGSEKPCLSYLRINEKERFNYQEFEDSLSIEFECSIPKYDECSIDHCFSYWVTAEHEKNRHKPVRFTRSLDLIIENHLKRESVTIRLLEGPDSPKEITVKPKQRVKVLHLSEISPGDYVYDFRFLPI